MNTDIINNANVMLSDTYQRAVDKAEVLTEAAFRLIKDKINLGDGSYGSSVVLDEFNKSGIKLRSGSKLLNLSNGNDSSADSTIGMNTFEIQNQLIQDYMPDNDIANSPFNLMLPFKSIPTIGVQQDIISSNYGWAGDGNGVGGALNPVPLLSANGEIYEGYQFTNVSYISGQALIALRELGVNDTALRGYMQRINLQSILLIEQLMNTVELNRIETLIKGSFTYQNSIISAGLGSFPQNIIHASQSLGAYTVATNTFTPNAALTDNLIQEMGAAMTSIMNTGVEITDVLMPNTLYMPLMNSQAVASQTTLINTLSFNNVMEGRQNLFRLAAIPALQNINLMVDNRAIKLNPDVTTINNTRPLMYGKTIESSSFRAIFLTRTKGLSKLGDMGFFPNVYTRTQSEGAISKNTGYEGNFSLITQDLSKFNVQNQQIQMIGSTCAAPMVYLPHGVYLFDFNVSVN